MARKLTLTVQITEQGKSIAAMTDSVRKMAEAMERLAQQNIKVVDSVTKVAERMDRVGAAIKRTKKGVDELRTGWTKHFHEIGQGLLTAQRNFQAFFRNVAALYVAFYTAKTFTRPFIEMFKVGAEMNSMMEQSRLGIAALVAGFGNIVSSTGKVIEGTQRWGAAISIAGDLQKRLLQYSLQTAASYQELLRAAQEALGPALSAGFNEAQIASFVKDMTLAAQAIGLPFDQLGQELRAIFEGDMSRFSRISRLLFKDLQDQGIVVKEQIELWRQQGILYQEVEKRLATFAQAGKESMNTYAVAVSNFKEAWRLALGSAFSDATSGATSALNSLSAAMVQFDEFGNMAFNESLIAVLGAIADRFESIAKAAEDGIPQFESWADHVLTFFNELGKNPWYLKLLLLTGIGIPVGAAITAASSVPRVNRGEGEVGLKKQQNIEDELVRQSISRAVGYEVWVGGGRSPDLESRLSGFQPKGLHQTQSDRFFSLLAGLLENPDARSNEEMMNVQKALTKMLEAKDTKGKPVPITPDMLQSVIKAAVGPHLEPPPKTPKPGEDAAKIAEKQRGFNNELDGTIDRLKQIKMDTAFEGMAGHLKTMEEGARDALDALDYKEIAAIVDEAKRLGGELAQLGNIRRSLQQLWDAPDFQKYASKENKDKLLAALAEITKIEEDAKAASLEKVKGIEAEYDSKRMEAARDLTEKINKDTLEALRKNHKKQESEYQRLLKRIQKAQQQALEEQVRAVSRGFGNAFYAALSGGDFDDALQQMVDGFRQAWATAFEQVVNDYLTMLRGMAEGSYTNAAGETVDTKGTPTQRNAQMGLLGLQAAVALYGLYSNPAPKRSQNILSGVMTGASIGAMTPFGLVGAVIGGIIGGIAGAFAPTEEGKNIKIRVYNGKVDITGIKDWGGSKAKRQIEDAMRSTSAAMRAILYELPTSILEGIGEIPSIKDLIILGKADGKNWNEEFENFVKFTVPNMVVRQFFVPIGQAMLEIGVSADRLYEIAQATKDMDPDDAIQYIRDFVLLFTGLRDVRDQLMGSTADRILRAEQESSPLGQIDAIDRRVRALSVGFADLTHEEQVERGQQILSLMQQRYDIEIQYLQQIRDIQQGINESIDAQITDLRRSQMTPEELGADILAEQRTLRDQLAAARTPEEVERITAKMQGNVSKLIELAGNTPEAIAQGIAMLQDIRNTANARLDAMEAEVEARTNAIYQTIEDILEALGKGIDDIINPPPDGGDGGGGTTPHDPRVNIGGDAEWGNKSLAWDEKQAGYLEKIAASVSGGITVVVQVAGTAERMIDEVSTTVIQKSTTETLKTLEKRNARKTGL